jgi:hypothetical protein
MGTAISGRPGRLSLAQTHRQGGQPPRQRQGQPPQFTGRHGEFEVGETAQQRAEGHFRLLPGKGGPQAVVPPFAETEMGLPTALRHPCDVQPLRLGERAGIMVGRNEHGGELLPPAR